LKRNAKATPAIKFGFKTPSSVVSRKNGAKKLHEMITANGVIPVPTIINGHSVL
jgi:hypothetical protein